MGRGPRIGGADGRHSELETFLNEAGYRVLPEVLVLVSGSASTHQAPTWRRAALSSRAGLQQHLLPLLTKRPTEAAKSTGSLSVAELASHNLPSPGLCYLKCRRVTIGVRLHQTSVFPQFLWLLKVTGQPGKSRMLPRVPQDLRVPRSQLGHLSYEAAPGHLQGGVCGGGVGGCPTALVFLASYLCKGFCTSRNLSQFLLLQKCYFPSRCVMHCSSVSSLDFLEELSSHGQGSLGRHVELTRSLGSGELVLVSPGTSIGERTGTSSHHN